MNKKLRFGWVPDFADIRDYTPENDNIKMNTLKLGKSVPQQHSSVDLTSHCSPIEDQGPIGSCTANAAASLVEYFENKAFGKHVNASRLFIYKTTRNILRVTGDTGASMRATLGALVMFGAPPEKYLPYDISKFDEEPSSFCYAFADNFKTIEYYRHDVSGMGRDDILESVKDSLRKGIPTMLGFTVYSSLKDASPTGLIPFPSQGESVMGGHAVATFGYDDNIEITNPRDKSVTKGALLIRNSYGTDWGNKGYGYLPYEYVFKGIANDFWSIIRSEWADSKVFTK